MAEHVLLTWLVIGALAGWLAGLLVEDAVYSLSIDVLTGVFGSSLGGVIAVLGAWVGTGIAHLSRLGVGGDIFVSLVATTLGVLALLMILRVFKQKVRGSCRAYGAPGR
jgi:uncharacterized membrane protein YeaQ/YmgE (transglycosylase-associated protein family)